MARASLRPILVATLSPARSTSSPRSSSPCSTAASPIGMLRYVASGPFPRRDRMGRGRAALGLAVHFAIMAVMAAVYMLAAPRLPALLRAARSSGASSTASPPMW